MGIKAERWSAMLMGPSPVFEQAASTSCMNVNISTPVPPISALCLSLPGVVSLPEHTSGSCLLCSWFNEKRKFPTICREVGSPGGSLPPGPANRPQLPAKTEPSIQTTVLFCERAINKIPHFICSLHKNMIPFSAASPHCSCHKSGKDPTLNKAKEIIRLEEKPKE